MKTYWDAVTYHAEGLRSASDCKHKLFESMVVSKVKAGALKKLSQMVFWIQETGVCVSSAKSFEVEGYA